MIPRCILILPALTLLGSCGGRRQQELAQCQVATHTADELVHCLAVDKNWLAEQAALAGKRRQQALDSVVAIQAAQAQAAWAADSQEHRYQLTVQCNYDALDRQYHVPRQ